MKFAIVSAFTVSNSFMHLSAALAKAANSCASGWRAVANAHAVLARFCMLESLTACAALANAANSCASD